MVKFGHLRGTMEPCFKKGSQWLFNNDDS